MAGLNSRRGVWAIALAAAVLVAAGGGYAAGHSGHKSGHTTTVPAQPAPKKSTAGAGDYRAGFARGRKSAYRSAYRRSYLAAFRRAANGGK